MSKREADQEKIQKILENADTKMVKCQKAKKSITSNLSLMEARIHREILLFYQKKSINKFIKTDENERKNKKQQKKNGRSVAQAAERLAEIFCMQIEWIKKKKKIY